MSSGGYGTDMEEFQANVQKSALGIRKRLRIGMGSRVYSNDLFQQIAQFFEEHEDLDVAFVTEVGLDFISQLRRGTLDLALDRLPDTNIGALEKELSICPLIREPQCVFCRRTIPRSRRTSISLYELQGCAITSGLEGSAEESTLLETCRRHGITLNRVYRSDGVETSMNLVRSGRCVALGPASLRLSSGRGGAAHTVDGGLFVLHLPQGDAEAAGDRYAAKVSAKCLPGTRHSGRERKSRAKWTESAGKADRK